MKNLLNHYQKNSLRISLLTFEENLRQVQEWLDGRAENGILYRRELTISAEKRKQASQAIRTALNLVEKLRNVFGLETVYESAASMLQGDLAINWANLIDTQAGKLRRYGKVHPELAGILDSDIQNLAGIALKLSSILGESQQEKT
ncbi:MAG: hypothetical protein JW730_12855 [Anaerolineales bacterium]|nr:hypothetical protein [Anaerolineales bacterium]